MKKNILLILISILSINTFANFTLNGYSQNSKAVLTTSVKEEEKTQKIIFESSNEKINRLINNKITKAINKFQKDNEVKEIKTILKANNEFYASVLIQANKENSKLYKGMVFDVKTGKELSLSDILAGDYKENLKNILNDRVKQFGLKTSKSFEGMNSVSSFYMEDDAIVLIFNKGKATNDYDELVFVPFFLQTLQQILK